MCLVLSCFLEAFLLDVFCVVHALVTSVEVCIDLLVGFAGVAVVYSSFGNGHFWLKYFDVLSLLRGVFGFAFHFSKLLSCVIDVSVVLLLAAVVLAL